MCVVCICAAASTCLCARLSPLFSTTNLSSLPTFTPTPTPHTYHRYGEFDTRMELGGDPSYSAHDDEGYGRGSRPKKRTRREVAPASATASTNQVAFAAAAAAGAAAASKIITARTASMVEAAEAEAEADADASFEAETEAEAEAEAEPQPGNVFGMPLPILQMTDVQLGPAVLGAGSEMQVQRETAGEYVDLSLLDQETSESDSDSDSDSGSGSGSESESESDSESEGEGEGGIGGAGEETCLPQV